MTTNISVRDSDYAFALGKKVGPLLKELRQGLNEQGAASRLGIGVQLYLELENGRKIPLPSQRAVWANYVFRWVKRESPEGNFIRIWDALAAAWGFAPAGRAQWEFHELADKEVLRPQGRDLVSDWQSVISTGKPRIRFVDGDHGAGKSTLVNSFLSSVLSESPDCTVAVCACGEHLSGGAYKSFGELASELVAQRVGPRLPARQVSAVLGDMLWKAPSFRASILEGFDRAARAVSGKESESRTLIYSEKAINGQYLQLLRYLVATPAILFIDDLQQADSSSLNLLLQLARFASGEAYPLYVITAFRQFDAHTIGTHETEFRRIHRELRLCPSVHVLKLEEGLDVGEFLAKRYAHCELPEVISELAEAATRGNPWLLQEIFSELDKLGNPRRMAKEPFLHLMNDWQDSLRRFMSSERQDKVSEDLAELTVKQLREKIGQVILETRLSQLDRTSMRNLLNHASAQWRVSGRTFAVEVLTNSADMAESYVFMDLADLEHTYLLVRAQPKSQAEAENLSLYEFWYWLYGSYIYEMVPADFRPNLHRSIAECLNVLYAGSEKVSSLLAQHYARGNEPAKAASHALRFARLQAQQSAWSTVRSWLELGLGWAEALIGQEGGQIRLDLFYELGLSYYKNGDYNNASKAFQKAIDATQMAQADPKLTARLWAWLAEAEEANGEYPSAMEAVQQGKACLSQYQIPLGEESFWLESLEGLVLCRYDELDRAVSVLRRVIEDGESLPTEIFSDFVRVRAYNCLGITFSYMDHYSESTACFRSALEVARRMGDSSMQADLKSNLAEDDIYVGQFDEAEVLLTEALDDARAAIDSDAEAWALGVLGNMYLESGHPADALVRLKEATQILDDTGHSEAEPCIYADLALAHLALCECEQARKVARRARKWAATRLTQGYWLDTIAQIEMGCGRPTDQARRHFERAIKLFDKATSRQFGARSRRRLAQLLAKTDDFAGSVQLLDNALATFRELELPLEIERTEKLLLTLARSDHQETA